MSLKMKQQTTFKATSYSHFLSSKMYFHPLLDWKNGLTNIAKSMSLKMKQQTTFKATYYSHFFFLKNVFSSLARLEEWTYKYSKINVLTDETAY